MASLRGVPLWVCLVTPLLFSACASEPVEDTQPPPRQVEVDPETATLLASLQEKLELRRFDDGVAEGESYLASNPTAKGVHYAIGVLQLGKQNYQAAVVALTEATQRDPQHVDAAMKLGLAHSRLGDLEESNRHLRRTLELAPGQADAAFLLGKNHSRLGNHEAAKAALDQAASALPAPAYFELGLLHQKIGETDAAERAFRQALAADAEHLAATYNLAQALIVSGQRAEGELLMTRHSELRQRHHELDELRKATLLDWAGADNFVQLAAYYLLHGELDKAAHNFEKALELEPEHSGAQLGLGRSLLERGDSAAASGWFERVVATDPTNHHGQLFLGICRHLAGNFEGAKAALAASQANGEWGVQEYLFFGNALLQTGALQDAQIAFAEAVTRSDEPSEAHRRLGLVRYLLGDPGGAAESWGSLAEARPDDGELWMLLGIAQFRAKGRSAAESPFRRALERQHLTIHGDQDLELLLQGLGTLPESAAAIAYYRELRAG